MRSNRRRAPHIALLVIGSINLLNATRSPDFAAIRTVHVVQLLATGAIFGAVLAMWIAEMKRNAA